MIVSKSNNYVKQFPENYSWECIDSIKLSIVAHRICKLIKKDLQTTVRNYVSGLRKALNIIAEEAII